MFDSGVEKGRAVDAEGSNSRDKESTRMMSDPFMCCTENLINEFIHSIQRGKDDLISKTGHNFQCIILNLCVRGIWLGQKLLPNIPVSL